MESVVVLYQISKRKWVLFKKYKKLNFESLMFDVWFLYLSKTKGDAK